jgi:hypothetical protein
VLSSTEAVVVVVALPLVWEVVAVAVSERLSLLLRRLRVLLIPAVVAGAEMTMSLLLVWLVVAVL